MQGSAVSRDRSADAPRRGLRSRLGGFAKGLIVGTWKLALVALFIVGGVVIGGFLSFVHQVQGSTVPAIADAPKADAIVVLTGGPGRIDAGLDLLAAERGERMLISGVNERTSGAAIRNASSATDEAERARLFACCIDLGREAADTVGNASEAREWITAGGYKHVLVVTADYHMPRSLLEFRRAMTPAVDDADADAASAAPRLTAWPVATPLLQGDDWYRDPAAIRRMLGEWGKYLSAQSKGWFGGEFLKALFPSA